MRPDIAQFRAFYDSRLGTIARVLLRRRLRALWPRVSGLSILGLGYATPYLGPFVDDATSIIAAMPAEQGAAAWPRSGRNRVALADEMSLPFEDGSIDRVILIHGLETSDAWRVMLRQIWRVLKPDGRLIVVAPNRRGMWSAFGDTPFGHGHPYSRGQLDRLLTDAMFLPEVWDSVLYGPPSQTRWVMRNGRFWERLGRLLWPRMPGLWIAECSKTMYVPSVNATPTTARRPALAPVVSRMTCRDDPSSAPGGAIPSPLPFSRSEK
jgi:SAM-dependent methyltransferase